MRFRANRPPVSSNKRGFILCEGETETMYFKGLVAHPSNKRKMSAVGVEIYKPKNHTPAGLVKEAKKKIKIAKREENPYEFAWVVFDKDGHLNVAEAFNEIYTNKLSPEIRYAFSVTCFEYYILLHFERTTKTFRKCDDIISQVEKYYPSYEKATNSYAQLIASKETAVANCDFVLAQVANDMARGVKPYQLHYYCNVHELVRYLENL